jgi:hypothetical protein
MITQTSDPILWDQLNELWTGAGWVIHSGGTYRVFTLSDGSTGFLEKTTKELVDSRSLIGSKPSSYKDWEIE